MKLITWNVNGLRACMNKGFADFMQQADADIFCVQETKMQREQSTFEFPGYHEYWNSAVKNVAAQPIDLKNPDSNHKNAGFSDQERAKFQQFLHHGFVDSFRSLYPDREGAYTWWSYMFKARERNAGWHIDYFLVSENGRDHIQDVVIHNEVFGSDHCPVELDWKE